MSKKKLGLISAILSTGAYVVYKLVSNKIKGNKEKEVIIETSINNEGEVPVYEPIVKKKLF